MVEYPARGHADHPPCRRVRSPDTGTPTSHGRPLHNLGIRVGRAVLRDGSPLLAVKADTEMSKWTQRFPTPTFARKSSGRARTPYCRLKNVRRPPRVGSPATATLALDFDAPRTCPIIPIEQGRRAYASLAMIDRAEIDVWAPRHQSEATSTMSHVGTALLGDARADVTMRGLQCCSRWK